MNLPQKQALGGNRMLRKLTIALIVLTVAVLSLTATSALIAAAAQPAAHNTCGLVAMPFIGSFSGQSTIRAGGTSDVGTGRFLFYGYSRVDGSQTTGTLYPQPYEMTITFAKGDTISLHVPPGSNIYQIDGGTGRFARVIGGIGHFSLHRSVRGTQETFTAHLDGTIVLV